MAETNGNGKLYLGVDVGGTKMLAALVRPSGRVLARERTETPREGGGERTVAALIGLIDKLLSEAGETPGSLRAIGLAVPGAVDAEGGRIVFTPNTQLTGVEIVPALTERFGVPVALGNDVNCGTLGEKWLGVASGADSVVGIFVGTGIGGGVVIGGKAVTGHRGMAGEIGHMKMRSGGPECGCGGKGCFEALASRSAMERDIRQGVADGEQTALTEILDGDLSLIKSGSLRKALERDDPLVKRVLRRASEVLGQGCLNVLHLLDPEVIVLGGGVIEACDFYIMPIVEKVVAADPMEGRLPAGGKVAVSSLGDDAVLLGAVAIAQQAVGRKPLKSSRKAVGEYPELTDLRFGSVTVDGKTYEKDVYVRADGKVKRRDKAIRKAGSTAHEFTDGELKRVCKGGPRVLFLGAGHDGKVKLSAEGETFLRRRGIEHRLLPSAEAVKAYNEATGRKACVIHLTC